MLFYTSWLLLSNLRPKKNSKHYFIHALFYSDKPYRVNAEYTVFIKGVDIQVYYLNFISLERILQE